MTTYQSGEILLLSLTFTDGITTKLRPVLVMLDTGDQDIVVARVTTSQTTQTAFDIEIIEWQQAGLARSSVVRLHKMNTVEKRLINRQLGILTSRDWTQVREKIKQIWSSI
jgi:mRNA interferase MazF